MGGCQKVEHICHSRLGQVSWVLGRGHAWVRLLLVMHMLLIMGAACISQTSTCMPL